MAGSIPRDGRQGEGVLPLTPMRHTRLGRTGLTVSRLCLGTMTFGLQCDETTSTPSSTARSPAASPSSIPRTSTRSGGNLDTVGRTEEIVGRWLRSRRSARLIVATKCFGRMGRRPWDRGPFAQAHPRRHRRLAATPAHRLRRSLPGPPSRPGRRRSTRRCARSTTSCAPARRATSAARTTTPTRWRARSGRSELLGRRALRLACSRATTCSSARSSASCSPLCREEGIGVIPVQPDRRRAALRQARSARPGPRPARGSRWATPRSATRSATGTSASSPRSRRCGRWPPRPGMPLARAGGGVGAGAIPRSRRRSSARADPSSSMTCWRRRTSDWTRRLKARLDELTQEYRWGDDAR